MRKLDLQWDQQQRLDRLVTALEMPIDKVLDLVIDRGLDQAELLYMARRADKS